MTMKQLNINHPKLDVTNANKTAAFLKASDWLKESREFAILQQQDLSGMAAGRVSRLRTGTATVSARDLTIMDKAFPGFRTKYMEFLELEAGGQSDLSEKIAQVMEALPEYKAMFDTIIKQNKEILERLKE